MWSISSAVEGKLLSQSSSPCGSRFIQFLIHFRCVSIPRLRVARCGAGWPGDSTMNSAANLAGGGGLMVIRPIPNGRVG